MFPAYHLPRINFLQISNWLPAGPSKIDPPDLPFFQKFLFLFRNDIISPSNLKFFFFFCPTMAEYSIQDVLRETLCFFTEQVEKRLTPWKAIKHSFSYNCGIKRIKVLFPNAPITMWRKKEVISVAPQLFRDTCAQIHVPSPSGLIHLTQGVFGDLEQIRILETKISYICMVEITLKHFTFHQCRNCQCTRFAPIQEDLTEACCCGHLRNQHEQKDD